MKFTMVLDDFYLWLFLDRLSNWRLSLKAFWFTFSFPSMVRRRRHIS